MAKKDKKPKELMKRKRIASNSRYIKGSKSETEGGENDVKGLLK
jgi:hypothetical protein